MIHQYIFTDWRYIFTEMHLKQQGFTYSACDTYTKNKERIQEFIQTGNPNCIYRNDLDKLVLSMI